MTSSELPITYAHWFHKSTPVQLGMFSVSFLTHAVSPTRGLYQIVLLSERKTPPVIERQRQAEKEREGERDVVWCEGCGCGCQGEKYASLGVVFSLSQIKTTCALVPISSKLDATLTEEWLVMDVKY